MIASMTGYGKAVSTCKGYNFETEVKSLNNRFLEISVKLPGNLQNREYELRELLKNKIKRGKIYINTSVKPDGEHQQSVCINESKIREVIETLKLIKKKFKIRDRISIEHIMSFKEIFTYETEELDDDHYECLKENIMEAVDNLVKMRQSEGEELAKDLKARVDKIASHLDVIEDQYQTGVKDYFEKLRERAKEIVKNIADYGERMEMELALLAERADISEECVRLRSHIKFFKEGIENNTEAGRKLNFLCQEMHREANTISAKSVSTEVVHSAVEIKDEVEKIREQVQNIE